MHIALCLEGQLHGLYRHVDGEGHDIFLAEIFCPSQAWDLVSALMDLTDAVLQCCSANGLVSTTDNEAHSLGNRITGSAQHAKSGDLAVWLKLR